MSGGRPNRLKGRARAELVELARAGDVAFDEGAFKDHLRCAVAGCLNWTRQQVRMRTASRGVPCCWECRVAIEEAAAAAAAVQK